MANPTTTQGTILRIWDATLPTPAFVKIGGVKSVTGLGSGQAAVIDVTTLDSVRKEKRKGLPDEGQVSVGLNWDGQDAGQILLEAARIDPEPAKFEVEMSNGTTKTFDALVLQFGLDANVDAVYDSTATLEVTGAIATV